MRRSNGYIDVLVENFQNEMDQSNFVDEIEGIGGYIQAMIILTDKNNTLNFRNLYYTLNGYNKRLRCYSPVLKANR